MSSREPYIMVIHFGNRMLYRCESELVQVRETDLFSNPSRKIN